MWEKVIGLFAGKKNPIDSIFEGIDRLVTTKEEKEKLRHKAIELSLKQEQMRLGDISDARSMYRSDSSLQKTFAIVFLIGYLVLIGLLMWKFFAGIILTEVAANFMFTIFGAMSTKVNTIVGFLFGSSKEIGAVADVAKDNQKRYKPEK